jgi:hypothetical protein
MHSTATELRLRLQRLPQAAQFLVNPAAVSTKDAAVNDEPNDNKSTVVKPESKSDSGDAAPSANASAAVSSSAAVDGGVYRMVLGTPPRIWSALDAHAYHEAALALLACPIDLQHSGLISSQQLPPWMREFKMYLAQFPAKIRSGAAAALKQRQWAVSDYAGALAALAVLGPPPSRTSTAAIATATTGGNSNDIVAMKAYPWAWQSNSGNNGFDGEGALALFLSTRSHWAAAALKRLPEAPPLAGGDAGKAGNAGDEPFDEAAWARGVEVKLKTAVRTLRRTVADARELFVTSDQASTASSKGKGSDETTPLLEVKVAALVAAQLESKTYNNNDDNTDGASSQPAAAIAASFAVPSQDKVLPAVTAWLATEVKLLRARAEAVLKHASTASVLARIRQGLWVEVRQAKGAQWAADCAAVLNQGKLASDLDAHENSSGSASRFASSSLGMGNSPSSPHGVGVDLWALLFSKSFASLGEGLLQASLLAIRVSTQQQLDKILAAVAGDEAYHSTSLLPIDIDTVLSAGGGGVSGRNTLELQRPSPMNPGAVAVTGRPAAEVQFCAELVVSHLEQRLCQLESDAASLVQHGDPQAKMALTRSLYLRSVEMAACFVNHLRRTTERLSQRASEAQIEASAALSGNQSGYSSSSSSSQDQKAWGASSATSTSSSGPEGVTPRQQAAAMQRHRSCLGAATRVVDGLLILARLARLLRDQTNSSLARLLVEPGSVLEEGGSTYRSQSQPDAISVEQLQAAFVVTDNDGDGQLDASEAKEAIEGVLACGHLLSLDASQLPTLTLPEFALAATALLEPPHAPLACFGVALNEVATMAHTRWAQVAVATPARELNAHVHALVKSAERATAVRAFGTATNAAEAGWRLEHGAWAPLDDASSPDASSSKTTAFSSSSVVPQTCTTALQRFFFACSAELRRVLGACDLVANNNNNKGGVAGGAAGAVSNSGYIISAAAAAAAAQLSLQPPMSSMVACARSEMLREVVNALATTYQQAGLHLATCDGVVEPLPLQLLADVTFAKGFAAAHAYFSSEANIAAGASGAADAKDDGSAAAAASAEAKKPAAAKTRQLESAESALAMHVDPVLLLEAKPALQAAARLFRRDSQLVLNLLLPLDAHASRAAAQAAWGNDPQSGGLAPSSPHADDAAVSSSAGTESSHLHAPMSSAGQGSTADTLALVPAVRRFTLLPLPLDSLHPGAGSSGLDGRTNGEASDGAIRKDGKDGNRFLSPHRLGSAFGATAESAILPEEAAEAGTGFRLLNNLTRFKW